jgi:hypothetical protein
MQLRDWMVSVAVATAATAGVSAQEKGGNFETGAYEVVPDWPRQMHEDYGWGRTAAVFAESPDRVFVFQSGELPRLSRPIGAGEIPIRPAALENNGPDGCPCPVSKAETGLEGRWEHVLMIFNRDGELVDSWEQHNHRFVRPHAVKISPYDRDRHVWIVEDGAHMIYKFTNDGERLVMSLGEFETPGDNDDPDRFNRPTDIAFFPNGDFVVSDGYVNARVVKFNRDGEYLMHWGTPGRGPDAGPGEMNTVHGIAIDAQERVYVSDRGNQRIQVFDASGGHLDTWPGIRFPLSMRMARDQNLWVNDGNIGRFLKFDLEGRLLFNWGTFGHRPGQMWGVHAFSTDSEGNLYTAEVWGGRAQKFRPKAGADPTQLIGLLNTTRVN